VDDRQIGLVPRDEAQQPWPIDCLPHDLDLVLGQQGDESLAQQRVVLDDHYSHGSTAQITVPSRGTLCTSRRPSTASTRCLRPVSRPPLGSAPPCPLSTTSTTSIVPSWCSVTRTVACGACLTTLVSDSATTKYAAVSTTGGRRWAMSADTSTL